MTSVTSTELSEAPQTTKLQVPRIVQRASDFGSASAREEPELLPCTLEGYEGVYWGRLTAHRIPTDDKKVRAWVIRDGHGSRLERLSDNTHWWCCKVCHQKRSLRNHCFKMDKSTSAAVDHMKDAHSIDEEGPVRKKARHGDGAMEQFINNGGDPVTATQNQLAIEFHQADFKALLYDWIITENVSFYQLESPKLHALL